MNPITIIRERIAESKRREEGVSEPPWSAEKSIHGSEYKYVMIDEDENYSTLELLPKDAAFIASARSDLPMWRSIAEQLLEALEKADSRLHLICGSYMALDHGEPEDHFYEALNKMGADMNAVRSALAAITQQLAGVGAS